MPLLRGQLIDLAHTTASSASVVDAPMQVSAEGVTNDMSEAA